MNKLDKGVSLACTCRLTRCTEFSPDPRSGAGPDLPGFMAAGRSHDENSTGVLFAFSNSQLHLFVYSTLSHTHKELSLQILCCGNHK